MNVLFVTYDFPYPTNSGGKNRSYHLIKHTAKNANVFLYSFVRSDYNPDNNEEILKLNVKKIKVSKRKKLLTFSNIPKTILTNSSIFKTLYFEKEVEEEMLQMVKEEKIDIVHFESSYTGFFIGENLSKLGVKQILGTENIEFLLYEEYARTTKKFFLKPLFYQQASRLKREELDMVKNSNAITTVTQSEADLLEMMTGKQCEVVPNGIEPEHYSFKSPADLKNNILFVGNFNYFPNIDAINFFCQNVFPKLDKRITLTIVGKNIHQKCKYEDVRIIKKDFVEDIIGEYRNADLLVFPIRIGGGTNFKVLEAMALGLPIVAQPERLSGLWAQEGEHFLKAITPDEYVSQIKMLYEDKTLRHTLATNSRALIEKHFAWDKIGSKLLSVWKNV